MEIQLTINEKEIIDAITFWLENVKGISGVNKIKLSSYGGGSSSATVKINEVELTAGFKKKAIQPTVSESVSKSSGRPLDIS